MAGDNIVPPSVEAKPGGGGGVGAWVQDHKGVVIGGAIAAGLLLYLVMRKKNASSSNTSSQNANVGSSAAYPYSTGVTGDTNFGDYYAGILNQLNANNSSLSTELTTLGNQVTAAINANTGAGNPGGSGNPTTNPSSGGAGGQPGYGIVQTSQGPMVWLGVWGQPEYQVGGGAPVYFGNASQLAQGNPVAGEDVYTPVAYSSQVSSKIS